MTPKEIENSYKRKACEVVTMKHYEVSFNRTRVTEVRMVVKAKDKNEALEKAIEWDYEDVDECEADTKDDFKDCYIEEIE